jgi:hypothetical protein
VLPFSKFSAVSITQKVDIRLPKDRYSRSRVEGNKRPYWVIDLTSTPITDFADAEEKAAYLDSLKEGLTLFPLPNPRRPIAQYLGLSSQSAASKNASTVTIKDFATNLTKAAMAGDFIQYANHPKAYRIKETSPSDVSGFSIVTLNTGLFADVPINTAINYGKDVIFQVCLSDSYEMKDKANGKLSVFDLALIEQG